MGDYMDYACKATKPPAKKKKDKITKFQKGETYLKWDKCGWMYTDSDNDEQITDLPPNSLDELSKHNDNQIVSAKMWLLREDHVLIKFFLRMKTPTSGQIRNVKYIQPHVTNVTL